MNWRQTILLLIICIRVNAQQYDAPKLICVQKTTNQNIITWELPNVTCGTFNGYKLFHSTNLSGPYTLLHTETNSSVITYTHLGISPTLTHYYYMESDYNCGAQTSKKSDTLDNTQIQRPEIIKVTIENNRPVVYWTPSKQNKVWGYPVLIPQVRILDTVEGINNSKFIDTNTDPSKNVLTYAVAAMDKCGGINGTSSSSFGQSPVLLNKVDDNCKGTINLNWIGYKGWPNDKVKDYQILVNKNNSGYQTIATHTFDNTSFIYTEFNYGDSLCIKIKATHPTNDTIISYSNEFCYRSEKIQKPNLLQIISASYISPTATKLTWFCDSLAQYQSFGFTVNNVRSGDLVNSFSVANPTKEGGGFYSYTDNTAPISGQHTYSIAFLDKCNEGMEGIETNTVYLSAKQIGLFKNYLEWTKPIAPESKTLYTIRGQRLYVQKDGGVFLLLKDFFNVNTFEYEHSIENDINTSGSFCYKLETDITFDTTTELKNKMFTITSTFACITDRTIVHIPNAFKINGVNNTFKPYFVFWSNFSSYNMKIFNRWGVQIFETNDPFRGWDGINNKGEMSNEDSYMYVISFIGNDNKLQTKTGNVILLK